MRNDKIGLGRLCAAAAFAARKHSTQRRKDADATPYINHPLTLADVLANVGGVTDIEVLCAALLHDTVEDTDTSADELRAEFGPVIAGIVLEVSDDKSLPKQTRKDLQVEHASHISVNAKLVKLADKICNVRDVSSSPPADWPRERRREYFEWSKRVVDGMRGSNAALEQAFDAAYRCGLDSLGVN